MKKFSKILVPFDGSDYSIRALDGACDISKMAGSKIYVITAIDFSNVESPRMFRLRFEAETLLQKKTVQRYKEKGFDIDYKISRGNPTRIILDFSKLNKIDLIIMGSKGLTGWKRVKAIGSVSRSILENSKCPVMIVH